MTWVSTQTTMAAPSDVVGMPGYGGLDSPVSGAGYVFEGEPPRTVLISPPFDKRLDCRGPVASHRTWSDTQFPFGSSLSQFRAAGKGFLRGCRGKVIMSYSGKVEMSY